MAKIKGLFLDIGGVLLTNGWDHSLRKKTAEHFSIEYEEMDKRHRLIFDTYETGKLTLDTYLNQICFYKARDFTPLELKNYIFEAASALDPMIKYIKEIKKTYNLKVAAVSNEGREIAVDRIKRFDLHSFIDFFIVSSFVHFRKPDADIYKLAIDVAQIPPSQIAYIDDRALLIEVGKGLGLQGICHTHIEETQKILNRLL